MIKQLLVGIDGCEYSEASIKYACSLARIHGARVQGIGVVDTAGIESAYHTPRPLGAGSVDSKLYAKNLQEARAGVEAAVAVFNKICREQDVPCQSLLKEGKPSEEILRAASLNDVVIIGKKTRFNFGLSDGEYGDTGREVLSRSVRPLILAPREHREVKQVMITLDFQRLTDRLIFNYIHLNPYPGARLHLVNVSKHEGRQIPAAFVDYFKVHGMDTVARTLVGEHPGQAIVNYAKTEGIDLAVIGVHTVSKVWAALIGSTGRFVIEHLDAPIYAQS